jgi:hypothetical protein
MFLRATLLFFSANVLNLTLHELSHAVTAYFLKVPATLFHFYVDINQNEATESQRIIIALVGPVFSLFVGVLFWILFKRSTSVNAKLFSLYAAILGINIFFGNLFSTAMVGDFSKVTQLLHSSQILRYLISSLGLLALISFMFVAGKEFLNFGLPQVPRKGSTILNILLIPWLLGTGLIILIYTPLPSHFIMGIISSSVFWIFLIIGAITARRATKTIHFSEVLLNIPDIVLFFISVLVVRILVPGIHFNP